MSPEKQRITIAEFCGWTKYQPRAWRPDLFCWAPPSDFKPIYYHAGKQHGVGDIFSTKTEFYVDDLPDYLNDLNAMHEAEKVLFIARHPHASAYHGNLSRILVTTSDIHAACDYIWHATAVQRAEAFLKTLNLWEES